MEIFIGKEGIAVQVIADSISPSGIRLLTLELVYPRFIHSELMTHRMLSKNAASSRAIPVKRALELIKESPAMPVFWGKNQPGMSAREELDPTNKESARQVWLKGMDDAIAIAQTLEAIGCHKQITNRVVEPWVMIKTVVSGTEWANIKYLRRHEAAQPEFKELMDTVHLAVEASTPKLLHPGQWHVPYVDFDNGVYSINGEEITLEEAKMVSASCCAQVSYRKLDDTIEKARDIFAKLNLDCGDDSPSHASPVEHQATPMTIDLASGTRFGHNSTLNFLTETHLLSKPSEPGMTHIRMDGSIWSGNFRGWIQHRQLIKNEAQW